MSVESATAVRNVGDGTYSGAIEPGWDILGNANGGYLLAIAARAASQAADGRAPLSITGHFLAPGKPGPATIESAVVKAGRRFTTVRATLSDAERPLLATLGTFGVGERHKLEHVTGTPADMPPPDQCVPMEPTATFPPPFSGKIESRIHPQDAMMDSGQARIRGWFRLLRDGEPVDPFGLIIGADAFPPTIFPAQLAVGWAPTLELTVHVRNQPVPGWIRCSFVTRFITGGFLEEDGELWDESGKLVALSRQLALLPK